MNDSGWIRRMRIKQGLKGFQLADRMQVSAARISVLEKDETRGAVTLKMMERAAKAMGCKFEYRIVQAGNDVSKAQSIGKPRYRLVEK
ncbi:MAG: helix-turn-helix domain-containing protein [Gammaproteobacteria bacterium]|jgi:transcriptional regulator with XRE-family HTH domain|nr:helix-turn-helix domain-containing protein [Gammaproteobacteria bacterium]